MGDGMFCGPLNCMSEDCLSQHKITVAEVTNVGMFSPIMKSSKKTIFADPGLVAVVAYNNLCTFEFGIAVEVFCLPRPEFDFPWYKFVVVGSEGRKSHAMGGIVVESEAGLDVLETAKTIILPGWRDRNERPPEKLLRALNRAVDQGARCLSICSGVFILAAAGLLDGRRATTHWRHIPDLKRLYPNIQVEEDVLYVDEGNVISSSGSAAGIDACLHLVRRDFNSKIANSVARRLVMPPHREGGQAQYVASPLQTRSGQGLGEVLDWARKRLAHPIEISELARLAVMSERTFLRRFQESVGMSPKKWLQRERMFRAREILETSVMPLSDIAEQCGYHALESFRVAFRRIVGTSPAAYRDKFKQS
jgi:AraC family transcriptional regulator, transcriptional activator FtrA